MRAGTTSFLRFPDHTQWHTTVGRTPLDEESVSRRDLYLTTHNTHNKHVQFGPEIPASDRLQTFAVDRSATGSASALFTHIWRPIIPWINATRFHIAPVTGSVSAACVLLLSRIELLYLLGAVFVFLAWASGTSSEFTVTFLVELVFSLYIGQEECCSGIRVATEDITFATVGCRRLAELAEFHAIRWIKALIYVARLNADLVWMRS
jgi:hypothetical protein